MVSEIDIYQHLFLEMCYKDENQWILNHARNQMDEWIRNLKKTPAATNSQSDGIMHLHRLNNAFKEISQMHFTEKLTVKADHLISSISMVNCYIIFHRIDWLLYHSEIEIVSPDQSAFVLSYVWPNFNFSLLNSFDFRWVLYI